MMETIMTASILTLGKQIEKVTSSVWQLQKSMGELHAGEKKGRVSSARNPSSKL